MLTPSAQLRLHAELARRTARRRRGRRRLLAFALVLGLYAGALAWLTRQVETGVERSLQPLPGLLHDRGADAE